MAGKSSAWQRATTVPAADPDLSHEAANSRAIAEFASEGRFTQLTFYSSLYEYLNLPIESALSSPNVLIRALALIDRRLGRRRFEALSLAPGEHDLVRLFYSLRTDAEGWEPSGRLLPNPRMQPTGRFGAASRSGGRLLERAVERRFVWARA
jgi:hypothetical protein